MLNRAPLRLLGVHVSAPDVFPNGPLRYPVRVLFLFTGNSARSQIAEALLQHKGGERFIVASAGTHPAPQVQPEAIAALRSRGIEWSRRRPKGIEAIKDDQWDLVITLCDRSRESCPTLSSRPVTAHWGIPDPAAIDEPARRMTAFADTLALLRGGSI